jgi:monothiol glutaredoxin
MEDGQIKDAIKKAIDSEHVMLFMKGVPDAPACGFSARTVQILGALGVEYAALDILPDPRIRQELSTLSGWPTIPQLFVDGQLVGGCDIVTEMFESGELAELVGAEQAEAPAVEPQSAEPAPIQIEGQG